MGNFEKTKQYIIEKIQTATDKATKVLLMDILDFMHVTENDGVLCKSSLNFAKRMQSSISNPNEIDWAE